MMCASINISSFLFGAATMAVLVLLGVVVALAIAKWGGGGD